MFPVRNSFERLTVKTEMDGSRSYYQHDNNRRVEFSGPRGFHRGRFQRRGGRDLHGGPIMHDEDVTMSSAGGSEPRGQPNRYNPYSNNRGPRGGKNQGRGGDKYRKRDQGNGRPNGTGASAPWSRIVIPFGKKMSKEYLLGELTRVCPVQFFPVNYCFDGHAVNFFVEDRAAASALAGITKLALTPEGQTIVVLSRGCNMPVICLAGEAMRCLDACLAQRCSSANHMINLADFHLDAGVKAAGFYFSLERGLVLNKVMDSVRNNAADAVGIDLRGNNLKGLKDFGNPTVFKSLTCLLLDRNLLPRLSELDRLKRLPLEELSLLGNPLIETYKEHADYVDDVRKLFPKLKKLDGTVFPAEIGFAIEQATILPKSQPSFYCNEDARIIAVQFIDQFYTLFDSIDRSPLINAYHSEAMFSTSAHRNSTLKATDLTHHILDSRNLIKVQDNERRNKLLHIGKSNIMSYFCRFPRTHHDPASFRVDLAVATPAIITFSVCGLFKEIENKSQNYPVRAFSRTFLIVPEGTGYCIINETLIVCNATDEQVKQAFKQSASLPEPAPITAPSAALTSNLTMEQQQMVTAFCQQSRMNVEWSLKCLQDNSWDFAKAASVFAELNTKGSIPPQAFVSI